MLLFILFCVIRVGYAIIPAVNLEDMRHTLRRPYTDNDEILSYLKEFEDTYYIDQYEGLYEEDHPRRLFNWINNMFKGKKGNETTTQATETYNEAKERSRYIEVERNLTETLTKLEYVLRQILDIVKFSRQDSFKTIRDFIPNERQKRSTNETVKFEQMSNHTTVNVNVTEKNNVSSNTTQNGRRSFNVKPIQSSEVKERLLHYINEGFAEIKNKIDSLRRTKSMFSRDVNFRIGYIIANIDVLDANMENLKEDMSKKMYMWNDFKIMNLYDTVKASSNAITNLMEVLKSYTDKLN